jgi:hypothetical protein
MSTIGYLVRSELKKHLGDAPEETRTCFVLPGPECKLTGPEAAEKAFEIVVAAIREVSRYPVIEEAARRKVFVDDLRPFRNSLILEKDGWKCYSLRP